MSLLSSRGHSDGHTSNAAVCGVVADRDDVCRRAASAERLTFVPADFFVRVPDGGDCYLLKNLPHNWSPDSCRRILVSTREAMICTARARGAADPQPQLLVIEALMERTEDTVRAIFQMVICEEDARA